MFSAAFLLIQDESDRNYVNDLYNKHQQMMFKVAFNILHNLTDAEDTVHNTIIKVIDNLEKIRAIDSQEIEFYLSVMTKNTAIDVKRKTYRLPESNMMKELEEMEADFSVEETVLMKMDSERIKNVMLKLSGNDYDILFMNLIMELSPFEIADRLEISDVAARQRLFRAKQNFINELEKEEITNDN